MLAEGLLIDGRFLVERHVGAGGMADVYKARDLRADRPVALKILAGQSDHAIARFAREALVLSRLQHPAIVTYLAEGMAAASRPYLAMEWLHGQDLGQLLKRGRLAVEDAQRLAARVASALAFAHAHGVVHRDIKPSNIFVLGDDLGAVKLLDFGIAQDDETLAALTAAGARLGTPGYMAPEQIRGQADVGPSTDVFALGCVLWECLTGLRAFRAAHAVAVQAKILLEELPPAGELCPEVPPALESLIQRMVSKDSADRPADGAAVAYELAAVSGEGTNASRVSISLSGGEQRLVSVLIAVPASAPRSDPDATIVDGGTQEDEAIEGALLSMRAHVERLADRTLIATMRGRSGAATDEAARAALAALEMRARLPSVEIAVATGKALPTGRLPVGEAIDTAMEILRHAVEHPPPAGDEPSIHLDEVTAGLLEPRFLIGRSPRGWVLLGQREALAPPRTLLGVLTPFVGRARVLGHLEATLEECIEESAARAILVSAPAGMGKSRLAGELVGRLRERGRVNVWAAQGDLQGERSPYGLFAHGLRRDLGLMQEHLAPRRRSMMRAGLARFLSGEDLDRVSAFLGEVTGAPIQDAPSPALAAARADSQLMAQHIRAAALDYLRALTGGGEPLLLVFDDLHWGDLPTIKLIDAALRELRDSPVMVLALARPEVHQRFPDLWSERAFEEIKLDGLPRSAQERLARHVLSDAAEPALLARLAEQSSGNAFYLEELIRASANGRDSAPETVLAMVQTRLETLPGETRRLMRAASVFGERFTRAGAMALLGRAGEGEPGRLEALIEAELVEADPGEQRDRVYRFRHALVREAAYATLTDRDRVLGHALAGAWLEARGESDAVLLADHFERGKRLDRAVVWYRHAAQQALAASAFDGVLRAVRLGVECGASGEDLAALRLAEVEALHWTGEYETMLTRSAEIVSGQTRGSAAWFRALRLLVAAANYLADRRYAITLAEMLLSIPLEREGLTDGAIAYNSLKNLLRDVGEAELADRVFVHALPIAGELPDWARLTILQNQHDGGVRRALAYADIADAHAAVGDMCRYWQNRINHGYMLTECGVYQEAEEVLRRCAAEAQREAATLVLHALTNIGNCLGRQGRLDEASVAFRDAIEGFARQGSVRLHIGAHAHLACAQLIAGRPEESLTTIEPVLQRSRGALSARPKALALFAIASLRLGRLPAAFKAAREAHELLEKLRSVDAGEVIVHLAWAEALWACGERPAARVAITRAHDYVCDEAALLPRDDWRACYLTRVWENVRVAELARSWSARELAA